MIPSESHSRTEIIRAIPDINDPIIVRIVAFEERIEFLTWKEECLSTTCVSNVGDPKSTFTNVWVAANRAVMLWSIGIDVSFDFK